MRRFELSLLLTAALAVGCAANPATEDDGGSPQPDGGGQADGGIDAGTDGGPTCVDGDDDGYGEGCALGPDCDDADPAVSPAASETCNGVDDDCDGDVDEDLAAPSCERTQGVCAGAVARCDGAGGFLVCDAADYGDSYEADETLCDGLDNDCDGSTDEGCTCTDGETQACGSDVGECTAGTQTCTDGSWGACSDQSPMGEVCDGLDNDCDGTPDEPSDLTPPPCALQAGVCAGSVSTCGGSAGWSCGAASYGADYEATESSCDGLDNDCDGSTDEGCECVDGATQSCGSDLGLCMAGTQTCTSGAWGSCAGEVAPVAETCDGRDEDCDGTPDNGVTGPACALQLGVCAGTRQRCGGTSGFLACEPTDYGADYEATESSCDGLDNDCDGVTDEGCDCIDGATQPCGLSAGVCERGVQTCSAGEWGACTGGVEPSAEICNGLDDDCNSASDDGLEAPACALQEGVCAGSVQVCGGASGWGACDASSYGPLYVAVEDGAADEGVCDGLDNDCDGIPDEGCTNVPVVAGAEDEVLPNLYHRHLVYLANFDGNWDVMFANLETGESRRLTTTPDDEMRPRIYGNHVVYMRGEDAAARAVVYDLTTDIETVIGSQQTNSATIAGGAVVFDAWNGSSWELYQHDLSTGATDNIFSTPSAANEVSPSLRGGRLAYLTDESGTWLTTVIDFTVSPPTVTTQAPAAMSAHGHLTPLVDHSVIGWTDARHVAGTMISGPTDDLDIYGAELQSDGSLGAESVVSGAPNAQTLEGLDGQLFAFSDYQNGNWDTAVGTLSDRLLLTTHPATQSDPTISGNVILWQDNRLGGFDIYGSALSGVDVPMAGWILINEILADPAAGADVNGDGNASTTQDEFVELINVTPIAIDLSGMTLSDSVGVKHTFPAGTVLPALGTIVVFGGGDVGSTALFGGARAQVASAGSLSLNNNGDTVTLSAGSTVIDSVTYGGEGGHDESIVPDPAGGATWVQHSSVTGSTGAQSPGTSEGGFGY